MTFKVRSGPSRFTVPKKAIVIADVIAEEIFAQALTPGTPLATESQMLKEFQVGRATLREALRLLEAEGLIVVRAGSNGGAVVGSPSLDRLGRLLSILFAVSGTTIGEVVVARRLFEPDLSALAAANANDDEIAALEDNVARSRDAVREGRETLDYFREFHMAIAIAGKNRALSAFWLAASTLVQQQVGVGYHREDKSGAQDAHEAILAAIKGRNPVKARAAMATHTEAVLGYLEDNHNQQLENAVRFISARKDRS